MVDNAMPKTTLLFLAFWELYEIIEKLKEEKYYDEMEYVIFVFQYIINKYCGVLFLNKVPSFPIYLNYELLIYFMSS